jgi:two-component system nitrogen regulation sensor histidine kinase GlnL
LLRGLAHEVNNPLGGVRGAAQLLEHQLSDPSLLEYTQLIVGEVDRLSALVQRVTQSRHVNRREPLNIHEVCERVRVLIESDPENSLIIERDYDPSLPDIQGDQDSLIQAVLNLARNAAQAGATKLWLRTRIARNQLIGEQLHALALSVQVVDNGPGIDPQFVDSMFYPLISGKQTGSGIGLAQAQSAAVAHGGLIECSRHRKPTQFTLLLPVTAS